MLANKKIDAVIVVMLAAALIFTGIFMFAPDLLGITAAATEPEYLAKMFDKEKITEIEIEADAEDWQEMLDNATAEEYISCNITINGEKYYNVGIRPKGNSSLSTVAAMPDSDRYSFKIKMDEYVDGQNYYGLSKFVVNNMQGDATYMKEYLSYDMFEFLGVNTPAYAFADITVNGEEWGFYLAVEAVEREWAERTYGSDYGQLYKPESMDMGGGAPDGQRNFGEMPDNFNGEMPNDFDGAMPEDFNGGAPDFGGGNPADGGEMPEFGGAAGEAPETGGEFTPPEGGGFADFGSSGGGADLVYTADEIESYSQIFDNAVFGDNKSSDKKRVIKALKVLNTSEDESEIEEYIDTDEVLRYFAVNTVLVNLDSYVSSFKHNYYLYEEDGVLQIIPWDLNLSFAGFQVEDASEAVNFPIDTPVMSGIELEERPLIGKLLENENYKNIYHEYINTLVTEYFDSGYFENKVNELTELISDYVAGDQSAFYSYEQFETAVETLKEFGRLRAESLNGQLDGSVPATHSEQLENPEALVSADNINISDMGTQGGGSMNREFRERENGGFGGHMMRNNVNN